MLDKEPMTRITTKHVMLHPFVNSLAAKFEKIPESATVPEKRKASVPLYLSHALTKIVSKEVINLKITKKKTNPAEP